MFLLYVDVSFQIFDVYATIPTKIKFLIWEGLGVGEDFPRKGK